MLYRRIIALPTLAICLAAHAGDKEKNVLSLDVLKARTVVVIVDPDAGVDLQAPYANRTARNDVETALIKWGRLTPVQEGSPAELLIVIRKGSGKAAQPTLGGTPVNNSPPIGGGSTGGTTYGSGRTGRSPASNPSDPEWSAAGGGFPSSTGSNAPHPQVEIGSTNDTFTLYRSRPDPMNAPPVWRYTARDALASPNVPAVEAFRKLIVESEKQLANTP